MAGIVGNLTVSDAYIGNGGFSGNVVNTWQGGLNASLFGVPFSLERASLTFVQNALTESAITGQITLSFFDEPVGVEIGINLDGSFAVKLAGVDNDGLLTLTKRDLLTLRVESLGFEVKNGEFATKLAGTLQPLVDIGPDDWPEVQINEMTIYADGRVDLDGGWLNLPEQKHLDLYGFSAELTQIGFGETDDHLERWIGFSGNIQLVADLALGAQFDGLRILWRIDDPSDIRLSLEGVGVDLTIPDVLAFKGKVRLIDDNGAKGFKGGVKLTLYSINLEIDAELLVINTGDFTAFYLYVNTDFPAGIPLASTGIALYGLAGLYGQNVEPNKTEQETWYENWYKGNRLNGDHQDSGVAASAKWQAERNGMAFGAGVTLGTATDNGFAVNGKLLFVLVLPGPIILLEGRANLLSERSKLGDVGSEPTFEALAVLDGQAGQFLLNVAAQYRKDSEGRIIDIRAGAEAFFDYHRADAWHLYLGQDEPREKRIRAEVISLFHADAYFMLSARDLRMGFWVGFDESWDFGPLHAGISAWIAADAAVSWKPVHVHGQLQLHGGVELSAFGFGLSIEVDALIAADAPTPFEIVAELHIKLGLPWPLPDLKADLTLDWSDEDPGLPPTPLALGTASCEHLKASEKWPLSRLPRYDSDGDGFWTVDASEVLDETQVFDRDLAYDEDRDGFVGVPVVPPDVRPVLSFAKPVFDGIGFPNIQAGLVEKVGNTWFEYHLVRLELHKKPCNFADPDPCGGDWGDPVAVRAGPDDSQENMDKLTGRWQVVNNGDDSLPNARLMLWSKTPWEWSRHEPEPGGMYAPPLLERLPEAPCPSSPPRGYWCVDWDDVATGTRYIPPFVFKNLGFNRMPASAQTLDVVYRPLAVFDRLRALQLPLGAGPSPTQLIVARFPYGTDVVSFSLDVPAQSSSQTQAQAIGAQAFYRGNVVDSKVVSGDLATIRLQAPAIDTVIVQPVGSIVRPYLYLYRVCYKAPLDPARQQAADAWQRGQDEAFHDLMVRGRVLEPDHYYRLTVVTQVKRNYSQSTCGDNDREAKCFTEHIYWRTGPPPGVYDPPDDDGETTVPNPNRPTRHEHYPEKGLLRSLSPYVDYTVPAPEARAVYRAYDMGVYFDENYVQDMYRLAGKPLQVVLYDANGNPAFSDSGDIRQSATYPEPRRRVRNPQPALSPVEGFAIQEWGANPTLNLTRSEVEWLYSLDQAPCVGSPDLDDIPADDHLNAYAAGLLLRPETLYEARLVADGGPGEQYAVYKWRFITSRFAHFRHHIGSFRGLVWDDHVLRGRPETPLLTAEQLARLEGYVASQDFEHIASLFGFGTEPQPNAPGRWLRPTPRRVDVTLLRDGTRRYGLLLESPEPLDPDRVEIAARYSHTYTLLPHPPGAARLVDARLAPGAEPVNNEYVDILLLQDQDLSNWRIEHTGNDYPVNSAFIDDPAYFTFPSDSAFKEGTLIRVHTGHAADDPVSGRAPIYRHHYAGADAVQLNAGGDKLRLVDARGNTVHSRFFLQSVPDPYVEQPMVAVWNTDYTRAFLFFPDGEPQVGDMPDGQYRLVCTFHRTVAGLPALKQENQTTDEVANLDLVIGAENFPFLVGDVNEDGVVDVQDVQSIAGAWREPAAGDNEVYDLNDDGVINIVDIQQAASNWGRRFDP